MVTLLIRKIIIRERQHWFFKGPTRRPRFGYKTFFSFYIIRINKTPINHPRNLHSLFSYLKSDSLPIDSFSLSCSYAIVQQPVPLFLSWRTNFCFSKLLLEDFVSSRWSLTTDLLRTITTLDSRWLLRRSVRPLSYPDWKFREFTER